MASVIGVLIPCESKFCEIWMLADTLGQLMQVETVTLESL